MRRFKVRLDLIVEAPTVADVNDDRLGDLLIGRHDEEAMEVVEVVSQVAPILRSVPGSCPHGVMRGCKICGARELPV